LIMRDYTTRYKLFFKLGVDEFDFPNKLHMMIPSKVGNS